MDDLFESHKPLTTCLHRGCSGYAPGATWYCSGECKVAFESAEVDRQKWETPPTPGDMTTGLRARLGS